jgi:RNA polymerase sigma-70 factor, ECF subfamily
LGLGKGSALDFTSLDDAGLVAAIARLFGTSPANNTALNEAVSVLYDRYGRLIYSVAIHVVGDVETAEEITQDVFVRACEGAGGYSTKLSAVSTWLANIARHRAIDELRRRSVRPEKDQVIWVEDSGMEFRAGLPLSEGLEDEIEISIQEQKIRQIVNSLPPDQRLVLELAYFKGMPHSQIAAHLGEPLGTIKSRIRLGMQRLRDALRDEGISEPL